jgi:hypothetical protein
VVIQREKRIAVQGMRRKNKCKKIKVVWPKRGCGIFSFLAQSPPNY